MKHETTYAKRNLWITIYCRKHKRVESLVEFQGKHLNRTVFHAL